MRDVDFLTTARNRWLCAAWRGARVNWPRSGTSHEPWLRPGSRTETDQEE